VASVDITPLVPGEHAEATAVVTRNFLDDPLTCFLQRRRRPEAISLVFGSLIGDAFRHGGGWAARSGDEMIGVSIWLPPGASPVPTTRHLRFWRNWLHLAAIHPSGFARAVRAGHALDELHPREPHWFLSILAVDGGHRGEGVGRRLVEAGLEPAHAAGLPVHLDTNRPENLPIYEALGFEVTAEITPLQGSPPVWGMRAG
jgi:GNAT superfamily N-acetyltransferase